MEKALKVALEGAKVRGHSMTESEGWAGPDQPHYICEGCSGYLSLYLGQVLMGSKTRNKCITPKKES